MVTVLPFVVIEPCNELGDRQLRTEVLRRRFEARSTAISAGTVGVRPSGSQARADSIALRPAFQCRLGRFGGAYFSQSGMLSIEFPFGPSSRKVRS